jgi:hypothetical protein
LRRHPFVLFALLVRTLTRAPWSAKPWCSSPERNRVHIAHLLLALQVALFTAAVHAPAHAQTWTGNNSNDWTDPGNWAGGVVPTTGTVTINTTSPNPTVLGVNGAETATSANLLVGGANRRRDRDRSGIDVGSYRHARRRVSSLGQRWWQRRDARQQSGIRQFRRGHRCRREQCQGHVDDRKWRHAHNRPGRLYRPVRWF